MGDAFFAINRLIMNKKSIITALFAIVVALTANAQLTDWQNLTNKNFVSRIIHDQNYLYVGTKGGGIIKIDKQSGEQTVLCRADGSMTDNTIQDMAIHDGALWVGTGYSGLSKITDGHIEKFDMKNAGFSSNQNLGGFYFGSDGSMLVGGVFYLYQFDGKRVTATYDINLLSPAVYVNSIKADKDGRIWVGCYDALNQATLCVFTSEGLVSSTNTYRSINRLETDTNGCLWMASERGLVKFDGTDFTAYTPENSDLPEATLYDLKADDKGNLWMVSGHYLIKFDGSHFESYPYQSHSATDFLMSIDVDGNDVYVGSRVQGLLRLTSEGLKNIPLKDSQLIDNTFTLFTGSLDRNGIFYGGTLNGLQTYNIGTGEATLIPMTQTAQTETDGDGDVWVRWQLPSITDTCLMEITQTATTVYRKSEYPFSEIDMNQMKFDHHNRLWLATNKGVYRRDGQTWTAFNKDNSGLSFNNVTCLAFDSNDRVWCGTFGGGLFLFDGSKWTEYTTKNSQLPSDYVGFVAVDNDDVLWLNCRDPRYPEFYGLEFGFGLTRFDGTTWKTYNSSNSPIPSNCLYDIKIDADNNKWLAAAGDVGIASFNGTDWQTYNVDNSGIAFNEVTKITIDDKRDLIWLTHYTSNNGNGLSVARLNCHNTALQSVTVPNTNASTAIYDLSGRQITTPSKGIYIKQGKKYVKE